MNKERLKQFRIDAGMSQEQLALSTGRSRTYINQLESGRSPRPSAESLYKISIALGVRMEDFFEKQTHLKQNNILQRNAYNKGLNDSIQAIKSHFKPNKDE